MRAICPRDASHVCVREPRVQRQRQQFRCGGGGDGALHRLERSKGPLCRQRHRVVNQRPDACRASGGRSIRLCPSDAPGRDGTRGRDRARESAVPRPGNWRAVLRCQLHAAARSMPRSSGNRARSTAAWTSSSRLLTPASTWWYLSRWPPFLSRRNRAARDSSLVITAPPSPSAPEVLGRVEAERAPHAIACRPEHPSPSPDGPDSSLPRSPACGVRRRCRRAVMSAGCP